MWWFRAAAGFPLRAGASSLFPGTRCSPPRARSIDLRILLTTWWFGWLFMVRKAGNVGARVRMVLLVLAATVLQAGAGQGASPNATPQQPAPATESSVQIASRLLQQLGLGLKGHSQ